ncbi:MAG: tetratricopeptide repeat protein [Verrucomicrobia bacterium]|nr:tetratricopeptide repeat protein [Verrucomicrobiota bacterium]
MRRLTVILGVVLLSGALSVMAQAPTDDSPEGLYASGLANFNAGRFAEAAAAFAQLSSIFGNEPSLQKAMEGVFYALGSAYYNLGNYPEAIEAFNEYLKRFPNAELRDEVVFRIASALFIQEDYDGALTEFKRLVEQWPNSVFAEDAAFQSALIYRIQERTADLMPALESFISTYPNSELIPQARLHLARGYFAANKLVEALEQIEQLPLTGNSLDHLVYANFLAIEIGDAAFDETEYDLALRAYRRVRTRAALTRVQSRLLAEREATLAELQKQRMDPKQAAARFRAERRLQEAIGLAKDAVKRLQDIPDYDGGLFHRIGRCFFSVDRFWEAIVAFSRVQKEATDPSIKEAGHYDLVLSLNRLRRFEDLVTEADRYLAAYGKDATYIERGRVPSVAFMRAESFINREMFEEAEPAMVALVRDYPEHPQRPRIEFYQGLSLAMMERFDEAIEKFEAWLKAYPDNAMRSEVLYWLPISRFFNGDYEKALPEFKSYATDFPESVYAPEAEYRVALCNYAMENFSEAGDQLLDWVSKHKDHPFYGEALVTAGDALAAEGRLEEAQAAYLRVPATAEPFQFMALKQAVKVFKALDTKDAYLTMKSAFERYLREHPDSPNSVEAAYQAGWALRQVGQIADARRLYLSVIERYGNNRAWDGLSPMLDDLRKLYPGEPEALTEAMDKMVSNARAGNQYTLLARLSVAQLRWSKKDADAISDGAERIASSFPMETLDAETLAYLGSALAQRGEVLRGLSFFDRLLADFPRSRYVDVAYARQAEAKLAEGDYAAAKELADKAAARAYEPALLMEAVFIRAEAQRNLGKFAEAEEDYNTALSSRVTPRPLKPRALLGLAACQEAQGDFRKAIPFYQRVYVLYEAYTDAVAQAYLKSGSAFEKIKDTESAVKTYQEMLEVKNLAGRPELDEARQRLAKLQS